jgi:N-acetylglucosamine-6-phosphate deacetylase
VSLIQRLAGVLLQDAVEMATANPAREFALDDREG